MTFRRGGVVVIDPAVHTPEVACYNKLTTMSLLPLSYYLPGVYPAVALPNIEASTRAIIVLGSASSVHDNLPWQQSLATWLKSACERGIPTLGLCFGHQFLAHIFGGEIGYVTEDQTKLKGMREIRFHQPPVWWQGAPTGSLTVSHREAVVKCPPHFNVMASSPAVHIDGIAHQTLPIWGFQAHPEAIPAFLENQEITDTGFDLSYGHALIRSFLDYHAT